MDLDGKINQEDFSNYLRQFVTEDSLDLAYTPLKIGNQMNKNDRWTFSRFGMVDPKSRNYNNQIFDTKSPKIIEKTSPGFTES